jgi:hypothetical protein
LNARSSYPHAKNETVVQALKRRHGAGLMVSVRAAGPHSSRPTCCSTARQSKPFRGNGRRCMGRFPQLRPLRNPGAVFHAARSGGAPGIDDSRRRSPASRAALMRPVLRDDLASPLPRRDEHDLGSRASVHAVQQRGILDTARDGGHARNDILDAYSLRSILLPSVRTGLRGNATGLWRHAQANFGYRKFCQQRHAAKFEAVGARSPKFAARDETVGR